MIKIVNNIQVQIDTLEQFNHELVNGSLLLSIPTFNVIMSVM